MTGKPAKNAIRLVLALCLGVIGVMLLVFPAAVKGQSTTDYDSDNDGLIEVANLAQLNAVRWDLDGDGAVATGSDTTNYTAAFPSPSSGMGCPTTGTPTGCIGYELNADLDFDSDDDGDVDINDHSGKYWNAGKGWTPIGEFAGEFEGNGKTISNLFISGPSTSAGLFEGIDTGGKVRNLGLIDVDVTGGTTTTKYFGGLAGRSKGAVSFSYVSGGSVVDVGTTSSNYAGGLVGYLVAAGSVKSCWASVAISTTKGEAGGLVGKVQSEAGKAGIYDSYSTGSVSSVDDVSAGLTASALGPNSFLDIVATTVYYEIKNSYATGAVSGCSGCTDGLVYYPDESGASAITASYWDTVLSGQAGTGYGGGTGKTTSEMQTPTSNTGIYADWSTNLWDFGDANHFPLLKADWDGDGTATAAEFGDQDPAPAFASDASIADQVLQKGVAYTSSTALPAASGGNHALSYSVDGLPTGLTLNAARKITGTPTAALAEKEFTYKVTDSDDDTDTLTFKLSVGPDATTLTGTPGNGVAHLSWTAIAGVSGWEYLQNEKDATTNTTWAAITGSSATTTGYKITGLDNAKEYDFKVRAFVGTGATLINGVESNKVTVNVADQTPALTGTIADQALTQGTSYTSGTAFPAATGGDAPLAYSVASLPSGISLNSDRELTGTATSPLAKTSLTYTVTDAEGDSNNANDDDTRDTATLTFNISVAPKKPANFSATPFDTEVTLGWTAIAGVTKWQVKQGSGSWTDIASSSATTKSHTVTALTNGTSYTFKIRAVVGTSPNAVIGVESDAKSATPSTDLVPVVATVTDKLYPQGVAVDFTLPAATGGDSHPSYTYTLTPNVSGIGLTFTASTRKLTGTPSAPKAKVTYTYTATETSDSDGITESTDKTFTIGIQPKKPAGFTATPFDSEVDLDWTAIAGVTKWQYQQDTGSWTDISGSDATTSSYTVTGLTNGTSYTFKVRAVVGSGNTLVNGVESDAKSATPATDLVPVVAVSDQTYTQGVAVDFTLPAATDGDSHPSYTYTLTPNVSGIGLTFTASTHKLTGTPSTPKAKVTYTYTATETNDTDGTTESTSKTFTIGIQPKKPANFSATPFDTKVTLDWTAIASVTKWQVKRGAGSWTDIASSSATTNSHTATGLTNGVSYTFKIRAVVGTSTNAVNGVESDAALVTPSTDLVPVVATVTDKVYVQGEAVDFTLPAATGGDGHPDYVYSLTPNVSGIGLTFTASTRKLTGTPSTPKAMVAYTYTATESNDSDETTESTSKTFTIGIQPKKPANFTAAAGDGEVTLGWTAIAGVSGWEFKQGSGTWTAITPSGTTTLSHIVTGLINGQGYTFMVRAFVGGGATLVNGVESDAASVTPLDDGKETVVGSNVSYVTVPASPAEGQKVSMTISFTTDREVDDDDTLMLDLPEGYTAPKPYTFSAGHFVLTDNSTATSNTVVVGGASFDSVKITLAAGKTLAAGSGHTLVIANTVGVTKSVKPTPTPKPSDGPIRISKIEANTVGVTLSAGDKVRLVAKIYGRQNAVDAKLGEAVTFEWKVSGEALPDQKDSWILYTAPSSAGSYTVTAKLDSTECVGKDDCTASFAVTVRRPSALPEPGPTPENPSGELPSILADADGNQYEVFTPVEGGTFTGEGYSLSAESGVVPNGEFIGVRMSDEGAAENVGMTHQRYTLGGNMYAVSVVDGSGAAVSSYGLNSSAEVCVPLPDSLRSDISDLALVVTNDAGALTILSARVRLGASSTGVCGNLSSLPATVAVGVIGAPPAVPTAVPTAPAMVPDTGGVAPSSSSTVVWMLLLAIAMVALGSFVLMDRRQRGVGV